MKNEVTYDQFLEMTNEQKDAIPLDQLHALQSEMDDISDELKDAKKALNTTILRRCEALGRATLRQAGKDTGTVTLQGDDEFNYKFEVPKKVEWDQKTLRVAVEKLNAEGKNIDEYVTVTITVPEAKYNAWPNEIKARFVEARMVKDAPAKVEIVERKK